MSKDFIFDIDPDELPFHDEDDLGEDEPRIVEYMVKKIKEQDASFILNPKKFATAMRITTILIRAAQDNCSEVQCSMSYDGIIGRDMYLKIVGVLLCFDEDTLNAIRKIDDGIIGSFDMSATLDDEVELNVAFKDVRLRIPKKK